MADLPEVISKLQTDFGILDSLLPFMLIFVMVFAVLQKTKIIGEGKRQFNTIVAVVMGLMVVIPHVTGTYPPGKDVVEIINTALPQVSLLVVVLLSALLLIGVFAPGVMFGGTILGVVFGFISLAAVVYIFGDAAGVWKATGMFRFLGDPDTQAIVIVISVFALIIWFITREEGRGDTFTRVFDEFKSAFGR